MEIGRRFIALFTSASLVAALLASPQSDPQAPSKKNFTPPLPAGAIARLGDTQLPVANSVSALACSPDRKTLASLQSDGTIRLWDLRTFKETRHFPGKRDGTRTIAFSPDGKWLASVATPNKIIILNTESGEEQFWPQSPSGKVSDFQFSLDGSLLAGRDLRGRFRLWQVADGKPHPFDGKPGIVSALAFMPDGKHLAVEVTDPDKGTMICLWNIESKLEVLATPLPKPKEMRLHATPEFKQYLCNSDLIASQLCALTGHPLLALGGEHNGTDGMALSPDSKLLATYRWRVTDDLVHVWEVASGEERCCFPGHEARIDSLAISRDSKLLFTGSGDGTVLVWDLLGLRRAPAEAPSETRLEKIWLDLAGKEPADAITALIAHPQRAIEFFLAKLEKEHRQLLGETERMEKLVASLDDTRFAVREKAQKELLKQGQEARQPLEKALRNNPTLELRNRVLQILGRLPPADELPPPSANELRVMRCLEVLEHIGNADAKALLQIVVKEGGGKMFALEAQAALKRLQ